MSKSHHQLSSLFALVIIISIVVGFIKRAQTAAIEEEAAKKRFESNITLIKEKEEVLLANYKFYKLLTTPERRKFIIRLHQFMDSRKFTGREIEIEPHMKMMIGAAAIKFSFGLQNFQLSSFKQILVYPEEYYSKFSRQYHKGEANGLGLLAFSWKHFQEGLDSPNDNLNLGVHEFAHAYFLQQTKMDGEFPFNDVLFTKLRKQINKTEVLADIKQRALFRDYAFRNEMEFFAIMSEHFFETPSDFKAETPVLYTKFGQVLQQDPTRLGM